MLVYIIEYCKYEYPENTSIHNFYKIKTNFVDKQ